MVKAALPNGRKQSTSLCMRQTKSEIAIAGGDHDLLTLDVIRAEATTLKAQEYSMTRAFDDGGL